METLALAETPEASRIGWMANTKARDGKPLVEVAATGPKVIAIAARRADRVMFALGASPERIGWGIGIARAAREAAGLDPDGLRFGAYVSCGCHPDMETAQDMVRGNLTVFARFAIMHGSTSGPLSEDSRNVMQAMRGAYDMHKHTQNDSAQAAALTPEFIQEYAAVGSPEQVLERLVRLRELGLDKIAVNGNWRHARGGVGQAARQLIETEVLPALRG